MGCVTAEYATLGALGSSVAGFDDSLPFIMSTYYRDHPMRLTSEEDNVELDEKRTLDGRRLGCLNDQIWRDTGRSMVILRFRFPRKKKEKVQYGIWASSDYPTKLRRTIFNNVSSLHSGLL